MQILDFEVIKEKREEGGKCNATLLETVQTLENDIQEHGRVKNKLLKDKFKLNKLLRV